MAVINLYASARIITRWDWAQQHAAGAWSVALAFFLLQLLGPFGDHNILLTLRREYGMPRLAFALDWLSYFAIGVMSLLVFYGLAIDLFNIALMLTPLDPVDFDKYTLLILAAAVTGTIIFGLRHTHEAPHVKNVEVRLKNLPPAFDGFSIVQISDLHVGPLIGRRYTQKVVAMANELKPDMMALTGDFVDGYVRDLAPGVAPLAELKAPHGAFFVTGNHEYYWDALSWVDKFRSLGLHVLLNEHVRLRKEGAEIIIAGVTDYRAGSLLRSHATDPQKALAGAPPEAVKVLLAHQSGDYAAIERAGADLQLSGHSHAGQYFPFTFLIRYFQTYYKGLNRYKNLQIYVNTGTGYWGPPLKTSPSEITRIVLRRGEQLV